MKILIIGSGAREYSLALSLSQDARVEKIYFAPGNGATDTLGENLSTSSCDELLRVAQDLCVSLVVVGPELPLLEGVADLFRKEGFLVFGPNMNAAILEGSKAFMKNFVKRHQIPTARFIETHDLKDALSFIQQMGYPIVIKADGLCGGKGVVIAQDEQEARDTLEGMLSGKSFGEAGRRVVVEEYLDGFELSVFAISDSQSHVILPAVQDHKRLLDGDDGPNTGGMGAYAPTPLATPSLMDKINERIIKPTLQGMKTEGRDFQGVLFCGIMVVGDEPYLLEFNVRFGDPECEVLLPLLKTPLLDILLASAKGEGLKDMQIQFLESFCMSVILATSEYPYSHPKPQKIHVDERHKDTHDAHLSYAGVSRNGGDLMATGGRVIACVGMGESLENAHKKCYALCEVVSFEGKQFRRDIGFRALK